MPPSSWRTPASPARPSTATSIRSSTTCAIASVRSANGATSRALTSAKRVPSTSEGPESSRAPHRGEDESADEIPQQLLCLGGVFHAVPNGRCVEPLANEQRPPRVDIGPHQRTVDLGVKLHAPREGSERDRRAVVEVALCDDLRGGRKDRDRVDVRCVDEDRRQKLCEQLI